MTIERVPSRDAGPGGARSAVAEAVRAGDLVFIGGITGVSPGGRPSGVAEQSERAFAALGQALERAGAGFGDVVELITFNSDAREIPATLEAGREVLPAGAEPAWTPATMTGTDDPEARVVMRAIAVTGAAEKRCIGGDEPGWWGTPYPVSAACRKGDVMFVSGQSSHGEGMAAEHPGHAADARAAMKRIAALAEREGGSLADVIDFCSFHHDQRGMVDSAAVHEEEFFAEVKPREAPAVTTIGVPALLAPGMSGQYRAVLDLTPGERIARTPASVWWHSKPIAGVSKKATGSLVGIAGQVSSDGDGEILFRGQPEEQARYAFEQIDAGLRMLGGSIADVVEITAYHKDARDWATVLAVGEEVFGDAGPAWTSVGCTGLFKEGYLHEIHAMAVLDNETKEGQ